MGSVNVLAYVYVTVSHNIAGHEQLSFADTNKPSAVYKISVIIHLHLYYYCCC